MTTASGSLAAKTETFDVLIIAVGSAGYVHPFAALGRALHERGQRLTAEISGSGMAVSVVSQRS